jgi:hypothetical protein
MKILLLIAVLISTSAIATPIFKVNGNETISNSFSIDKDLIDSFGIYTLEIIPRKISLWNGPYNNDSSWSYSSGSLSVGNDLHDWTGSQGFSFYFETFGKTYYALDNPGNFTFYYSGNTVGMALTNDYGNTSTAIINNIVAVPEPGIIFLLSFGLLAIALLNINTKHKQ